MQVMQIGQLARQAGVAIDTVRYYERQGLLPPPQRRASGYRDYDARDSARLRFIRRAKDLGLGYSRHTCKNHAQDHETLS